MSTQLAPTETTRASFVLEETAPSLRRALAERILQEARLRHSFRGPQDFEQQYVTPRGRATRLHLQQRAGRPEAWLTACEIDLRGGGRRVPVLHIEVGTRPGADVSLWLMGTLLREVVRHRLRNGAQAWLSVRASWPALYGWLKHAFPGATPRVGRDAPGMAWHIRDTLLPALGLLSPLAGRSFTCRTPLLAAAGSITTSNAEVEDFLARTRVGRSEEAYEGAGILVLQRLRWLPVLGALSRGASAPPLDSAAVEAGSRGHDDAVWHEQDSLAAR